MAEVLAGVIVLMAVAVFFWVTAPLRRTTTPQVTTANRAFPTGGSGTALPKGTEEFCHEYPGSSTASPKNALSRKEMQAEVIAKLQRQNEWLEEERNTFLWLRGLLIQYGCPLPLTGETRHCTVSRWLGRVVRFVEGPASKEPVKEQPGVAEQIGRVNDEAAERDRLLNDMLKLLEGRVAALELPPPEAGATIDTPRWQLLKEKLGDLDRRVEALEVTVSRSTALLEKDSGKRCDSLYQLIVELGRRLEVQETAMIHVRSILHFPPQENA